MKFLKSKNGSSPALELINSVSQNNESRESVKEKESDEAHTPIKEESDAHKKESLEVSPTLLVDIATNGKSKEMREKDEHITNKDANRKGVNEAKEGGRLGARFAQVRETKSKKMQIAIYPSLHKELKDYAKQYKTSVNDLINSILLEAMDSIKNKH